MTDSLDPRLVFGDAWEHAIEAGYQWLVNNTSHTVPDSDRDAWAKGVAEAAFASLTESRGDGVPPALQTEHAMVNRHGKHVGTWDYEGMIRADAESQIETYDKIWTEDAPHHVVSRLVSKAAQ